MTGLLLALALTQAGQAGPGVNAPMLLRLQDEGATKGYIHTLNLTGAGASCTASAGKGTCTISGGGGGSPGGSGAELQYRSGASSFGAVTNVTSDGTHLVFTDVTAPPSAPVAGVTTFFHSPVTTDAPAVPSFAEANSGANFGIFPFVGAGHGFWGCLTSGGGAVNGMTATGVINSTHLGASSSGAPAQASTSLATRIPMQKSQSAAAANSLAGYMSTGTHFWRGDGAGKGGFHAWLSWTTPVIASAARVQVGVVATQLGAAAQPSASVNAVYIGCDSTDTNMGICSNDGAGTATCSTLGASFPCVNTAALYNAYFWAAPNAASVGYAIERLDSAATASGSVNSNLPVNTVFLKPQIAIDTAADTNAATLYTPGLCYWANP